MQHYNPTIAENQNRILNLKGQQATSDVIDVLQPVLIIESSAQIVRLATITNSAGGTIYTTPADKDFYLTSVQLAVTKDVTSTSTGSSLRIVIDGVTQQILSIPGITLTPQSQAISLALNTPIKIDRNTNITCNNGTGVANIVASGTISGYLVETTK